MRTGLAVEEASSVAAGDSLNRGPLCVVVKVSVDAVPSVFRGVAV